MNRVGDDRGRLISPRFVTVALHADGTSETSNPARQAVLGWSEAEVADRSIFALVHPDDAVRTRDPLERVQQGQPSIEFEIRCRAKDRDSRWIGIPEES